MKKNTLKALLLALFLIAAFSLSASAVTTERCTGPGVEVGSFSELKEALQSYRASGNIILTRNITAADDNFNYEIEVAGNGAVTIDLNGYKIGISSKSTKYLFNITGQANLYFINSSDNKDGPGGSSTSTIGFNTTCPGAAIVKLGNKLCEVTNVNVNFIMGEGTGYKTTTDSSDTAVFLSERGSALNIYSGTMRNSMTTGCGVILSPTEDNKSKLKVQIGGNSEISAHKYSVSFDPSYVKYIRFGSVSFTQNGTDTFERIHLPSGANTTIKDLWSSSESGGSVTLRNGGLLPVINHSTKITSLDKKENITASKQCEGWSNQEDVVILQCCGGHVKVCGTCFMSYRLMNAHNSAKVTGRPASCTSEGRTNGEKCSECGYSSARIIPKTGHDMVYSPGVEVSCGVNGKKENYFCKNCSEYYADANGDIKLDRNEIIIENNHVITHLPEKPATCTEDGLSAGVYCETCKEYKTKQEVIPAKGHTEVPVTTAINATCTFEGRTAGVKCSVCNTVLEPSEVIPQKPHETKIIEGYPASCTEKGLSFGEQCMVCGYVVKAQEVVPAKGHIEMIIEGKRATCVEDGLTDGLACEVCGLITKPQEKIAKGAHVPKTVEGKKASCKEEGLTDGSVCETCGLVLEEQKVIPVNDNHEEKVIKGSSATCTSVGKTDGVECALCGKILEAQAEIPMLPHTEKVIKGTPATCEKEGLTDGISCGVCSFEITKQEVTPKLSHTEKVVPGTPATCEKEGLTDGVICSVCEKILTEQKATPKLSHTEKILDGIEPTCRKEGVSSGIVCSTCGEVIKSQKLLPKKEHTVSASIIRASFDSNGEITETCSVCKESLGKKTIGKIASVKLSLAKYLCDGKTKKPSVIIKTADGKSLERNTDYTLTYDKGRKAIGTYKVKVEFIGNYTGEKTLTFTIGPAKTDKITVKQSTDAIKLSWKAVEGATGYRVYLYNEKAGKYKALGTTKKLSCTIKKLTSGTEYKFAVKAYTDTAEGVLWSKTYTEITTATKPLTPEMTGKAGTSKASLSWNEVKGAVGYVVYISEKKDSGYEKIGTTSKLSCTIKNLKKGKTYYFKVKAYTKANGKNVASSASKAVAIKVK